ncbi:hypothetical protein J4N42_20575 [Vibrio sp. SCSIO 43135]|uniref:hypothetical protein n=1 Tax=Vibrio sp. SCSIO 43135 TaxID=2819096 RepID=UPI002075BDBB|nr:hypothetical protein [Vibrio sp. SCSIO 43135]USD42999.1 hypothetical protein J4N42_20575 [Vibrio sp. SCSIO 43135]
MPTRFFALATLVFSTLALALPAPEGDTVLWVNGNIGVTNIDSSAEFDLAMIDDLEQNEVKTNNHVVEEVTSYRGPKISSILEAVGAKGEHIKVIAWDDYVVTIPIADIDKYGVLLATHENDKRMTIDGKGPLFVVFPFTDYPELQNDLYYNWSVWQVMEIVVE